MTVLAEKSSNSHSFNLQCLKNIVRLGLEKVFMKVGYYDTEQ